MCMKYYDHYVGGSFCKYYAPHRAFLYAQQLRHMRHDNRNIIIKHVMSFSSFAPLFFLSFDNLTTTKKKTGEKKCGVYRFEVFLSTKKYKFESRSKTTGDSFSANFEFAHKISPLSVMLAFEMMKNTSFASFYAHTSYNNIRRWI